MKNKNIVAKKKFNRRTEGKVGGKILQKVEQKEKFEKHKKKRFFR